MNINNSFLIATGGKNMNEKTTEEKNEVSQDNGARENGSSNEQDGTWYVLYTFAGDEKSTKENIERETKKAGMGDRVQDVLIPTQTKMEVKDGEKVPNEEPAFPGYVFIKMVADKYTADFVKGVSGVTGFITQDTDPLPVKQTDMAAVLEQVEDSTVEADTDFTSGDTVKIIDGAMEDMTGTVTEVRPKKGEVEVKVDMFGRSTPVELTFDQVELM